MSEYCSFHPDLVSIYIWLLILDEKIYACKYTMHGSECFNHVAWDLALHYQNFNVQSIFSCKSQVQEAYTGSITNVLCLNNCVHNA